MMLLLSASQSNEKPKQQQADLWEPVIDNSNLYLIVRLLKIFIYIHKVQCYSWLQVYRMCSLRKKILCKKSVVVNVCQCATAMQWNASWIVMHEASLHCSPLLKVLSRPIYSRLFSLCGSCFISPSALIMFLSYTFFFSLSSCSFILFPPFHYLPAFFYSILSSNHLCRNWKKRSSGGTLEWCMKRGFRGAVLRFWDWCAPNRAQAGISKCVSVPV